VQDLVETYGEPFMAYVLNLEGTSISDGVNLTDNQQQVVDELRKYAALTKDQQLIQRRFALASVATHYSDDDEATIANVFRKKSGGRIYEPMSTEDQAVSLLIRMGCDVYPGLLLPTPDGSYVPFGLLRPTATGLSSHPMHQAFCRAVLDDSDLGLLFPGTPDSSTLTDLTALAAVSTFLFFSSGRGGGVQLVVLADILMKAAYDRLKFLEETGIEAYVDTLSTVVHEARRLARGKRIEVPLLVGYKNVAISNEMIIKLPWDELRHRRPIDDDLLGGDKDAGLILSAKGPLKILRKGRHTEDLGDFYSEFEEFDRIIDRTSNLTRFALLLASPGTPYVAAHQMAQTLLGPLDLVPHSSWRPDNPLIPTPETVAVQPE
jgi:hypothetical protein